jgi:hypothetical protein
MRRFWRFDGQDPRNYSVGLIVIGTIWMVIGIGSWLLPPHWQAGDYRNSSGFGWTVVLLFAGVGLWLVVEGMLGLRRNRRRPPE